MDERRVPPETLAGDPFAAAAKPQGARDHPHCCNDGWVSMGQTVVDDETGEETIEYALYLCRRCGQKS
jgi:hypothetical protein